MSLNFFDSYVGVKSMSKTSLVARQYRLREWASMIRECNQRPVGMSVDEWCNSHSITKANYYYRMKQVRKACLEAIPKEPAEQSVVPVPAELMTMEIPADATQIQSGQSVSASLEIKVNDITLCVTELTSSELLTKVLQVIRDVK